MELDKESLDSYSGAVDHNLFVLIIKIKLFKGVSSFKFVMEHPAGMTIKLQKI